MKIKNLLTIFLCVVCLVVLSKHSLADEKEIKENRPKEEPKKKPEIIDLEVLGILVRERAKGSLPDGVEVNVWFVKTKFGALVQIPTKNSEEDLYLKQFESNEVIVKGKGTIITEKNEKGEDVKITRITKFISIELKRIPIEIADKPIDENKEVKKEAKKEEKKDEIEGKK